MSEGSIYIMTNRCLKNMVKIGYATDVEVRRKQLSTTALPYEYEVYATYETSGNLEDIPVGAELVYIEDAAVVVTVESERKVIYKDEITSLSAIVGQIKGVKSIQGSLYFTYNGRPLIDIANETQWKDC